jgi:hypothetical protein
MCHPNHPDCVTGTTCTNCEDGFNPTLDVACNLVVYATNPIVGIKKNYQSADISVGPNPTTGRLDVTYSGYENLTNPFIQLFDMKGNMVDRYSWDGSNLHLNLSDFPKGIYMMVIQSAESREVKRIVLQ